MLVQVMIMALLIGLISTYLVQWALQRYQLVARHEQFVDSFSRGQGCINEVIQGNYQNLIQRGTFPPLNQQIACVGNNDNQWGSYIFTQAPSATPNSPLVVTLTRNITLP